MWDLTFSGKELAVCIAVLCALVGIVILLTRKYLAHKSREIFPVKKVFPLSERNKKSEADILRRNNTVLLGGFTLSLAFVVSAFSYTTYENAVYIPIYDVFEDDFTEVIPPTPPEKTPPPPLPPPLIEPVPDEEPVKETEFLDQSVTDTDIIAPPIPTAPAAAPPTPPTPPAPEEFEAAPLIIAEKMPYYLSDKCTNSADEATLRQCAQKEMLQFIYRRINYPPIARENGISGMAVVRFTVTAEGNVENAELLRDPGAGIGAEALRVVNLMGKWQPGRQAGRNVPVYFNLPIRFELQ